MENIKKGYGWHRNPTQKFKVYVTVSNIYDIYAIYIHTFIYVNLNLIKNERVVNKLQNLITSLRISVYFIPH